MVIILGVPIFRIFTVYADVAAENGNLQNECYPSNGLFF